MSRPLTVFTPQMVGQLRTLVESSPLPMVGTEGRTHVVRFVNTAFRQLVGQAAGELVGTSLRAREGATPHAPGADAVALLDLVYDTGAAEFGVNLGRVFGDEHARHLPSAVWPIAGTDNHPVGLLILLSAPDGTLPTQPADHASGDELRDMNGRLVIAGLKAEEQAELQNNLRGEAEAALTVRDEFISIAAHELRTPVTGIKLGAEMARHVLQSATPDLAQVDKYLLGIVGGAGRLAALISDLLDVSRMRSGELVLRLTPIDLAALVRNVVPRYADTVGEHHTVTTDFATGPLMMTGDALRLEQILDNLLSNAVKYSPAGGEIGVRLCQARDGIVLTVSDAGIGLPPGAQERIFEPFGRADNARRLELPGMGLGLHICRQIAEAHGGRMWAESAGEDRGMTVSVWFPLTPPAV
jgi:signal transduction histidine kinase